MSSAIGARGPYRNGIKRRQQIIETASATFALQGYSGATLREIAQRVGVTPGAVLAHFRDKEELLLAVMDRFTQETQSIRESGATGLAWFLGYPDLIRYQMAHPGLNQLFLTLATESWGPAHPAHDWVKEHYESLIRDCRRNLQIAIDAGEVSPMTDSQMEAEIHTLYATMDGLQLQWLNGRTFEVGDVFDKYFQATLKRWGATGRDLHSD